MKTINQLRFEFGGLSGGTIEDYVYQYMESEIHDYGKHLQGKVLDLKQELEDAKYEIETLRGQIVDRDSEIKELKEDLQELSDTLGLRNRSNPDLTIEGEDVLGLGQNVSFREQPCEHCNGSGYDPYPNHDTTMRPCPKCSGI